MTSVAPEGDEEKTRAEVSSTTTSSRASSSSFSSNTPRNRPSRGTSRRRLSADARRSLSRLSSTVSRCEPGSSRPSLLEGRAGRKSPARAAVGGDAAPPQSKNEASDPNDVVFGSASVLTSVASDERTFVKPLRRDTEFSASCANDEPRRSTWRSAGPPARSEENRLGNVATLSAMRSRCAAAETTVTPVAHAKPSTSVAPSTTRARVL